MHSALAMWLRLAPAVSISNAFCLNSRMSARERLCSIPVSAMFFLFFCGFHGMSATRCGVAFSRKHVPQPAKRCQFSDAAAKVHLDDRAHRIALRAVGDAYERLRDHHAVVSVLRRSSQA